MERKYPLTITTDSMNLEGKGIWGETKKTDDDFIPLFVYDMDLPLMHFDQVMSKILKLEPKETEKLLQYCQSKQEKKML
jgi:hypothetical protein